MSDMTKKFLTEINHSYAKLYDGVSCDFSPDEIDSKIEHIDQHVDLMEDFFSQASRDLFESDSKMTGWITFCVISITLNAILFLAIIS